MAHYGDVRINDESSRRISLDRERRGGSRYNRDERFTGWADAKTRRLSASSQGRAGAGPPKRRRNAGHEQERAGDQSSSSRTCGIDTSGAAGSLLVYADKTGPCVLV